MRTGIGVDVHAFGGLPPLKLAGVVVAEDRGLLGTSDADVAIHAVCDALLGAAALGDLGTHFPSSDPRYHGVDSGVLLVEVTAKLAGAGLQVGNIDVTVISQSVRIAPYRTAMVERLAVLVGKSPRDISVKATTTDGLGVIGRDEGVAAVAVAAVTAL